MMESESSSKITDELPAGTVGSSCVLAGASATSAYDARLIGSITEYLSTCQRILQNIGDSA